MAAYSSSGACARRLPSLASFCTVSVTSALIVSVRVVVMQSSGTQRDTILSGREHRFIELALANLSSNVGRSFDSSPAKFEVPLKHEDELDTTLRHFGGGTGKGESDDLLFP